ncbi:MAG: integration host factor subunit beta [Candidatus Competibacteraceae bacterium]|nr:integration host factor subunit beta [Candidatus Competibacteraceae bacterium]
MGAKTNRRLWQNPLSCGEGVGGAFFDGGTSRRNPELIEILARKRSDVPYKDVEQAVKTMLEQMSESLAGGERIEVRGFGSFSLHFRPPRIGRNPKTGDAVTLTGKYVPHFKPGKELRERVNDSPCLS